MTKLNHNGGPPLDVDAKMRWVRINLSDILEGMEGLTWEQRGFYCTALFKMYARMEGLPYDEKAGSTALHCDVRTYRRLRDVLIKEDKFFVDNGVIKNKRVEREIADFCREVKRRRDAALQREENKRKASGDSGDPANFSATSGGLRAEFSEKSSEDPANFQENKAKKFNENKGCDAATVAEKKHSSGGNQKPETRNQIKSNNHQQQLLSKNPAADDPGGRIDTHALYDRLVDAANGSLYPLALGLQVVAEPVGWIESGADLEKDILPVVSALGHKAKPQSIRSWNYFAPMVSQARDARLRGLPPPIQAPKKRKQPSRFGCR